jgi:hypothetical protein
MTGKQVSATYAELCGLPPELPSLPSELPSKGDLAYSNAKSRIAALARHFQDDVAYAERWFRDEIGNRAKQLVPVEEQSTLGAQARAIFDRYAVADALALRYRDRTRTTFIGLLGIAFLAVLIFELFAHILPEFFPVGAPPRLILWLYPVLWLGAWGLWYYVHCRQYQKKFHDYRALAEGLRVQFFWNLLGLQDPVEEYYLRKQKGELDWIRRAIAWWRERDTRAIPAPELTAEHWAAQKDLVRRLWVQSQLDYFTKAERCEERKGKRCKRWGVILFWMSFGLAVILGGCEVWHLMQAPAEAQPGLPFEESVLIFAIAMLLAGAAIAVAYGEKMAFAEHTREYAATRILFEHCSGHLTPGPLTPEEKKLFRTLGKEALRENGDWLLLHRDRPLEVIVP